MNDRVVTVTNGVAFLLFAGIGWAAIAENIVFCRILALLGVIVLLLSAIIRRR